MKPVYEGHGREPEHVLFIDSDLYIHVAFRAGLTILIIQ
jgi:hypothetical protein